MNPTVITTGPGVIIATATASKNCCSVSQPYSFTTPPYKKGTIANPLPKTNAPALVKNQAISASFDSDVTEKKPKKAAGTIAKVVAENFGGAFASQTATPLKMTNQIFSS